MMKCIKFMASEKGNGGDIHVVVTDIPSKEYNRIKLLFDYKSLYENIVLLNNSINIITDNGAKLNLYEIIDIDNCNDPDYILDYSELNCTSIGDGYDYLEVLNTSNNKTYQVKIKTTLEYSDYLHYYGMTSGDEPIYLDTNDGLRYLVKRSIYKSELDHSKPLLDGFTFKNLSLKII